MITKEEFLVRQPSFPEPEETDVFYLDVANRLVARCGECRLAQSMPGGLLKNLALNLVGYLQDVACDAGLWRSFVDACRELYGRPLPFYAPDESYIDYELNPQDVRFIVWYTIAMLWEEKRCIYPLDKDLLALADVCYSVLDEVYESAPAPEGFNIAYGLEFNDPDDHKSIYRLGNWLFLHSYLLTPAFAPSLRGILSGISPENPDFNVEANARLEEAMMNDTTGPLALFTSEWVYLMLERKLPKDTEPETATGSLHPYYKKFTEFTGGEEIRFFSSYDEMNRFFISALGWEEGVEHLSQAKGADDYVLLVTPRKGMLMARDVARCIAAPSNPLYNPVYARKEAFSLLCDRGRCPGDLLRFIFRNDWLPDAVFPGTDDHELVARNRDFIARCFLQIYYRGD